MFGSFRLALLAANPRSAVAVENLLFSNQLALFLLPPKMPLCSSGVQLAVVGEAAVDEEPEREPSTATASFPSRRM